MNKQVESIIVKQVLETNVGMLVHKMGELEKNRWTYKPIMHIGQGSFGTVFKSIDSNGSIVAVKKVLQNPQYKNRELSILQAIHSPNCLTLKDYYREKDKNTGEVFLFLVTDVFPMSLKKHIQQSRIFQTPIDPFTIKLFAFQLLNGINDLHKLGIAHRDIKPENVLVDPYRGTLKICDFGSAKYILDDRNSVSEVGSLYYRPPELLLGNKTYGLEIDIWSAGCVIAEMLLDDLPLFQGESDPTQIEQIVKIIGPPTMEDDLSYPHSKPFPDVEKIADLSIVLPSYIDQKLLQMLSSIFVYNPSKRPTAEELLQNSYFDSLFEAKTMPNGNAMPHITRPL